MCGVNGRGAGGMSLPISRLTALDRGSCHDVSSASPALSAHSSRGPGRRPLTAVTRVQIPYALPTLLALRHLTRKKTSLAGHPGRKEWIGKCLPKLVESKGHHATNTLS